MLIIDVLIGVTRFITPCEKKGTLSNTPINVFVFLKRHLVEYEYDNRYKKWKIAGKYFRYIDGYLIIPIKFLPLFERFILDNNASIERQYQDITDGDEITLKQGSKFSDRDYQVPMIDFLSNHTNLLRGLEMQTGKGKTYCSIRALSKIGKRALIIVPANLIDQWYRAINEILILPNDSVAIIKGSKSISEIEDRLVKENKKPTLIIASISTLIRFIDDSAESGDIEAPQKLIERLGIGVKIIDECHMSFRAVVKIDLSFDIRLNLYLSATYVRTNRQSNRIFNIIFDREVKYGIEEYDRYISIIECQYSLRKMHDGRTKTARGYSQIRFEKDILRHAYLQDHLFENVILRLIKDFYLADKLEGHKLLILVGLRDMAYTLGDYLRDVLTEFDLTIQEYLGEHSDDVLEESDIIISTTGSCGTGKDIKNLKTCILFTSFGAKALTSQTLGRLRKLSDGTTPEFIYLICKNLTSHIRHAEKRRLIYKSQAKEYKLIDI
jgi:superfamily II DNA or RNA helicase